MPSAAQGSRQVTSGRNILADSTAIYSEAGKERAPNSSLYTRHLFQGPEKHQGLSQCLSGPTKNMSSFKKTKLRILQK